MSDKPCKHEVVNRSVDGSHYCDDCGAEFFHFALATGKIQAMEPMPTLRDQFAMAALCGMHANPHFDEGLASPEQRSHVAYIDADAMMKARTA